MKLFSCLKVLGGDNFSIASVFSIGGLVPSLLMLKPSHSTCLHANLYFLGKLRDFPRRVLLAPFGVFGGVSLWFLSLQLRYRPDMSKYYCSK